MIAQTDCPAPDCNGELAYVSEVYVSASVGMDRSEVVVIVCVCDTCQRVWVGANGDWEEVEV
jgi:uncharacterized protein with PIN domain